MVLLGVDKPRRGVGKPPVDGAASQPGELSLVAKQATGEAGLDEGLAETAHDLGGGVLKPVKHPHQAWAHMVAAQGPLRRVVAGQQEQVIAFGERQAQPASEGCGHLLGRLRPVSPFEPGVVVGGHAAELCDLFTAQAAGAAPGPAEEPDVLGLQRLAASAQKVCEFWPIHNARLPSHGGTCMPTTVTRRYPRPGDPPITVARRPAPSAAQPRIADQWISGSLLTPAPSSEVKKAAPRPKKSGRSTEIV